MHVGDRFRSRGMDWVLVGLERVEAPGGVVVVFGLFRAQCHTCGEPVITRATMFDADRVRRRCPACARPGKKVTGPPVWLRSGVFA